MGRNRSEIIRGAIEFDGATSKCKNCSKSFGGTYITNLLHHLAKQHSALLHKFTEKEKAQRDADPAPHSRKRKFEIEVSEEEVTDDYIDIIAIDGRPLTFLDSNAFRTFSEPIFKGLKMNTFNSHSVLPLIEEKYQLLI